jgi:opacity protein-like surface antigen
MKSLKAIAIAAALAAPVAVFAQSNQPVTRAQVRSELIQLEKTGYNVNSASPYYPADIQVAQARVAGQGDPDVGGAVNSASASGGRAVAAAAVPGTKSLYFGQ